MTQDPELIQEIEMLRERLSRLSEASVRINESLDLNVVLQDVIDNARQLTNARYGLISTIAEDGGLDAFLTSGTTEEEHRGLRELPEGRQSFLHYSSLPGTLIVENYSEYAESQGLNGQLPIPVWSGFAAPIRHHGTTVGTLYLAHDQEGRQFSREDEEIIVMFASQAAMAIVNARRYRDEQRARADLETLINTSPVGVAVFDARTGDLVSSNREASRMVDSLRTPDNPSEHLLESMSVRRADGREVPLAELSTAEVLSAGETIRAEEVVFHVPDGRSISVLMNATPIRSEDGEVESVVVTLQDMTQMHDMERLRAEFLAMVSHELRTPLTSIRGSVTTLIDGAHSLRPTEISQFLQIILTQADAMRELISDLLDVARIETGSLSVAPEPTSVSVLLDEARTGFLSGGGRHNLDMVVEPDIPWVMADRPRIVQVLTNLIANAARHSPESSPIEVSAVREEFHVAISVSDEGGGIPAKSLPQLFHKFSRIDGAEQGGDTGLGLAICKGIVEAHGGRIRAESDGPGMGARFIFSLPTVEGSGFISPGTAVQPVTRPSRRASREQVRILVLDDDPTALRYTRDALVDAGYEVIATTDPEESVRLMEDKRPHLALLDLMLPGTDGMEIMKEITDVRDVPVVFVSAYGQDHLIARAFEMGADDYVVKPFSPTELVARCRAALRRRETEEPPAPYVYGALMIDYADRLVTLAGVPVEVTAMQYRLLVELTANAGRVVNYKHLMRRVWDLDDDSDVRPIRTTVSALRRKLGDDGENPTYIFTELRVGYRMPRGSAPPTPG